MNRKIAFRAWSLSKKKMLDRVLAGPGDPCSIVWDEDREEWLNFDNACGVIMQSTGLHDKHGRDIYEGDILYHDDVRHWPKTVRKMTAEKLAKYPLEPIVVEWNEARAGFDPFVSEDDEQGPYFSPEKIEIVGNIYEHPELTHGKA